MSRQGAPFNKQVHEGEDVAAGVVGLGEEPVGAEFGDRDGQSLEVGGRDRREAERGLRGDQQVLPSVRWVFFGAGRRGTGKAGMSAFGQGRICLVGDPLLSCRDSRYSFS